MSKLFYLALATGRLSGFVFAISLGLFCSNAFAALTPCVNSRAGVYPCTNVDLVAEIDLSQSGLPVPPLNFGQFGGGRGSGVWGWIDRANNRNYALMGMNNKLAIVDITEPENPKHLADMPAQTERSLWREVSVIGDFAVVTSEAMGHGLQILDLRQLNSLERKDGKVHMLSPSAYYSEFGSSHTVFGHTATGYVYAMGSDTCEAGVHVVDMKNPLKPKFSTCLDRTTLSPKKPVVIEPVDGDGVYTHDMMCVVYRGPDADYTGREICVASNDDTLNVVDVTDKANPKLVSVTTHPQNGFIHQGWFTEDQRYYAVNDELDELIHDRNMTTKFYDFSDLDAPKFMMEYDHGVKAVDHNHFVKGRYLYQANYLEGLTVLDLGRLSEGQVSAIAKFDTTPDRSGAVMNGIWNVFPYFDNGLVIMSSIDDGRLYIVRPNLP